MLGVVSSACCMLAGKAARKQKASEEACKREDFICSRMLAVDKVSK